MIKKISGGLRNLLRSWPVRLLIGAYFLYTGIDRVAGGLRLNQVGHNLGVGSICLGALSLVLAAFLIFFAVEQLKAGKRGSS